jgi:hypothetical protein
VSSDARRKAEDALAEIDSALGDADEQHPERASLAALCHALANLMRATRALLNASAPAAGEREEKPLQISGMHDSCDWCQREIPDGCYGVLCSECDTKAHDALDTAQPPRPAQDAVREAAELAHLDLLSYDEAVTGNEKRHALSRCKNALRDVLRTIDAAIDAARKGE